MAYSSSGSAGKHRRPGKHRSQLRAAHQPGAPALMGTAVIASAAAALLHVPSSSASDTSSVSADAKIADATVKPPAPKVPAGTDAGVSRSKPVPSAALAVARAATKSAYVAAPKTFSTPPRASRGLAVEQRAVQLQKLQASPDWVKPVVSYTLTAGFGEASGLWSHRHTGQDFAAPIGTQVRSIGDGTVVFAQYDGSYGRKIIVRHDDGTETWYCHLSAFMSKVGDTVGVGDVIGLVGVTGNTTGPHLHFEVRPEGGEPIDPMPWLRAHGVDV